MVNNNLKTSMNDIAILPYKHGRHIITRMMNKLNAARTSRHPSGENTDQICLATNLGRGSQPRLKDSYIMLSVVFRGNRYQQASHRVRYAYKRMQEYGEDWIWDFSLDLCHDCHNKWCQDIDHIVLRSHADNVAQTMFACFLYSECTECRTRHYICKCPIKCQRTISVVCSKCN